MVQKCVERPRALRGEVYGVRGGVGASIFGLDDGTGATGTDRMRPSSAAGRASDAAQCGLKPSDGGSARLICRRKLPLAGRVSRHRSGPVPAAAECGCGRTWLRPMLGCHPYRAITPRVLRAAGGASLQRRRRLVRLCCEECPVVGLFRQASSRRSSAASPPVWP